MKTNTREILVAVMAADKTITEPQVKAVIELLDGSAERREAAIRLDELRPFTMNECCQVTGLCSRSIHNYVKRGKIRSVAGNGVRACRYVREDVLKLVSGSAAV